MPEIDSAPRIGALLDENVPEEIRQWLQVRKPSWEVLHVYDIGLRQRPDGEVFDWALTSGFLIVTFDVAFADGRAFPVADHFGIIRLRVWPTTVGKTEDALERLFDRFNDEELTGSVVVVGNNTIRRIPRRSQ